MLDLQHLKTFLVVATTKNFTRAADELDYSQSSVTHHIKGLERELGVRLFNRFRFTRRVVLTQAGGRIYEYAARLLALADETKAAAQRKEKRAGRKRDATNEKVLADFARTSR
jgi:DNA-binding transcriptional LysR family regulator